ncbi:hydrogenase assembly chaperone hypC/hupF, partial [mine drainage metagenome]
LAVPARVVAIDETDPTSRVATVDANGSPKRVVLIYTPEVAVGSYVVVQAGFATRLVPEAEALEAIEYARALRATDDGADGGP